MNSELLRLESDLLDAGGARRVELLAELSWQLRSTDSRRAEALAREALELLPSIESDEIATPQRLRLRALTLVALAAAARRLERFDEAWEHADAGLGIALEHENTTIEARARSTRCEVLAHRGAFVETLREIELAQVPDDDPSLGAMLENNRGRAFFGMARYDEAERAFRSALARHRAVGTDRDQAICLVNVGNALSQLGDIDGALAAYHESYELQHGIEDSYLRALCLINLATVQQRLGDNESAIEKCEECLAIVGPGAVFHAPAHLLLGLAYRDTSELGLSRDAFEAAVARAHEIGAGDHLADALAELGHTLVALGRPEKARASYEQCLDVLTRVQAPLTEAMCLLGMVKLRAGEQSREDALATMEAVLPRAMGLEGGAVLADVHLMIAETYEGLGEYANALEHHKRYHLLIEEARRTESRSKADALSVSRAHDDPVRRAGFQTEVRAGLEALLAERSSELRDTRRELERTAEDRDRAERERTALESQFRHAQKMEAVGRLAGGIAHDFNNLLTVIRGFGEVLSESLVDGDELSEAAGQILDAADRASRLTSQLLTFGRRHPHRPRVVDPNTFLSEWREVLGRLLGADVEIRIETRPVAPILVDPGQLEQVLMNLVINACDAMPRGGRLGLSTDSVNVSAGGELPPGPYTAIRVTDTGEGIVPEHLSRVFDPFFTTKLHSGGTGLGLSTVYGIVSQSAGGVRVESSAGSGTRFEILFPEASGTTPDVDEQPVGRSVEPQAPATILLVEDEPQLRRLMCAALARAGHDVLEASDGLEAIELAGAHDIDLVVSDVVLPYLGGPDLMNELRRDSPSLRFLFTSGYPDRLDAIPGQPAALPFLQKPFGMDELAAHVSDALAKPAE